MIAGVWLGKHGPPARLSHGAFKQRSQRTTVLFQQRRNQNMLQAAGTTLALIFHQTVYNLRTEHRNAIVGILLTILQTAMFMGAFMLIYLIIGIRQSPIRGNFFLFIMSGIFIFMTHVRTAGAVSGAHSVSSGMTKHGPLNPAILIGAAAVTVLYRQTISMAALLWLYHVLIEPLTIDFFPGVLAMYLLAWFSGATMGLIFLGIRPWSPQTAKILTSAYQRINMFASGKMFVANVLPNALLPWFSWNPLFHINDQTRGFVFVNYTPLKTDPYYALWFSMGAVIVGLLINFTTRKYESISWTAGR